MYMNREEKMKRYIHDYQKREKAVFELIKKDKTILPVNKKHLIDYYDVMIEEELSPASITRNLSLMVPWARMIKTDFKKASNEEIKALWKELRQRKSRRHKAGEEPRTLAILTKNKYRDCLRSFYKRLYELDEGYPEQVQGLKKLPEHKKDISPEGLLSLKDIAQLVRSANSIRDKAFIALLADTGARVGEIGAMDIENLRENEDGFIIVHFPFGKTGARTLPLLNCKPLLLEYLESHPRVDGEKSPLFVSNGGNQRFKYQAIRKMLQKTSDRAGISKAANPHHYRHSTASLYAKQFSESVVNKWFGWAIAGGSTAQRYIHLNHEQLKQSYLEFYNSKENILKIRKCQNGHENWGGRDYCKFCNAKLKSKTILIRERVVDEKEEELWAFLNEMKKEEILNVFQRLWKEKQKAVS